MSDFDFSKAFPNTPVVRDALLADLAIKPWDKGHCDTFYVVNARVIDPKEGKVMEGQKTIKIEKGKIVSVDDVTKIDANASQYDAEGRFVCPGLIDAHVHVTAVPGVATMSDLVRLPEQVIALRSTYILKGMLQRGFTSVRDTGGATKFIADALKEGLVEGPRLFQCGKAISQTGGHGDLFPGQSGGDGVGCCGGKHAAYGRTADGVPACLKAVREELKQGADFIKIMVGGGVSSETDAIDTVQYTAEELKAITTTAWQMGKKMCTAHAYTVEAINHAIDNGVKGIEHGNLLDKATAERMAKEGVYLTPTLSCYGIMLRKPFENFLSPDCRDKSVEVMQEGLTALKMAHDAGVTICYGSDLLISMQACQTEEFSVRATVLDSPTLLRQATINPAKMLGKEGILGVVAAGAMADFLILDKNPLEDITVLDRPELYLKAVFKEGKLVRGEAS